MKLDLCLVRAVATRNWQVMVSGNPSWHEAGLVPGPSPAAAALFPAAAASLVGGVLMPPRQRRASPRRVASRRRATYLAGRLGVALRESRLALGMTQADAADRAGVSQPFWSRLERGRATVASLETLAAAAAAVETELAAFVQARTGADLPRDIEHLRRQELVIRLAAPGGWRARAEAPIDPRATRSRSIDVHLSRGDGREAVVVEIIDLLADVGEAFRGLEDKVAAVRRSLGPTRSRDDGTRVAGLLIIRATRRNRALIASLSRMFLSRFPADGRTWLRASRIRETPMPQDDGFVWSSVRGDRLFAARQPSDEGSGSRLAS